MIVHFDECKPLPPESVTWVQASTNDFEYVSIWSGGKPQGWDVFVNGTWRGSRRNLRLARSLARHALRRSGVQHNDCDWFGNGCVEIFAQRIECKPRAKWLWYLQ